MSTLKDLQAEIAARMLRGESFGSAEDLIDRSHLPEDAKAALWLYGWSFVPAEEQRGEAVAHIDAVIDREASAVRAVGHLRVAGEAAR